MEAQEAQRRCIESDGSFCLASSSMAQPISWVDLMGFRPSKKSSLTSNELTKYCDAKKRQHFVGTTSFIWFAECGGPILFGFESQVCVQALENADGSQRSL